VIFLEQPNRLDKAYAQQPQQQLQTQLLNPPVTQNCITYDSSARQILISCPHDSTTSTTTTKFSPVTLTDIYNQLNNPNVLNKEQHSQNPLLQHKGAIWLLDASLVINKDSALTINSKDTSWLKILTDENTNPVNAIIVHGSLNIDNVKLTSWNPVTNNYAQTNSSREAGSDTVTCGSDCSSD
jgi:hypothetical protein